MGCQVNQPAGGSHTTALHYAVSGGHKECMQMLLQYGAEINSVMTSEEVQHCSTPLFIDTGSTFISVAYSMYII